MVEILGAVYRAGSLKQRCDRQLVSHAYGEPSAHHVGIWVDDVAGVEQSTKTLDHGHLFEEAGAVDEKGASQFGVWARHDEGWIGE